MPPKNFFSFLIVFIGLPTAAQALNRNLLISNPHPTEVFSYLTDSLNSPSAKQATNVDATEEEVAAAASDT